MAYSRQFRRKVRDDYVSGKCSSLRDIERVHKINFGTILRWRREDRWDQIRSEVEAEAEEQSRAKLVDELARSNEEHFGAWKIFLMRVLQRLKSPALPSMELDALSRVLDRVQKGQRLALGVQDGTTETASSVRQIVVEFESLQSELERQGLSSGFSEEPGVDMPALVPAGGEPEEEGPPGVE